MGGIIDKITDFIKEMLQGWVLSNLETMFTDVNDDCGGGQHNAQRMELRHFQHDKNIVGECDCSHSGDDHQLRADL